METTTEKPAIELEAFCAKLGGQRYHLDNPFNRGGFRYATDVKVIVRIKTTEADTADSEVPDAGSLKWPERVSESKMEPWPQAAYRFEQSVSQCDCGEDYVEWKPEPEWMPLGVVTINTAYHYLISQLPNVRYLPHEQRHTAIYFRFNGGEGLLMPMMKF